jgi:hypothetical protein
MKAKNVIGTIVAHLHLQGGYPMKDKTRGRFRFLGLVALGMILAFALIQFPSVQAQIPGLPSLPGGIKVPGVPSGKSGFSGLDALSAAKDLSGQQNKTSYPTPNIAVSGSNVVIGWPNGVVTIESIAADGTIHRTVLGPPSEKNIP